VDQGIAEYYLMPTPPPRTQNHHSDTGKEVVYDQTKEAYADPGYGGLEVNPYQHVTSDRSSEKHLLGHDTKASRWSRKRKMVLLWTGGILVVLIIIVIAAVLATTLHKENGGTERKSSDDSQTIEKGPANASASAIASNSSLAATAWVVDPTSGSYVLRLIYQDTDGQLQSSTFNSETKKWTKVNDFMRAASHSPLALTRFNQSIYNDQAKVSTKHAMSSI
jgi:hypothetical protein